MIWSMEAGAVLVALPVPAAAVLVGFCGVTGAPVAGCFATVCAQVFGASAAGQADCCDKSTGPWCGGGKFGAPGAVALLAAVFAACVAVCLAAKWALKP